MRVLVIGATGFIGREAARWLAARGHEVIATHRRETPPSDAGVTHLRLERDGPGAGDLIAEAAPDAVVHNVAMVPAHLWCLERCARERGCPIVVTSSMDVYRVFGALLGLEDPPGPGAPTGEDAPVRTTRHPYRAHASGEDDPRYHYDKIPVEAAARRLGVPVTAVRLPIVLGPRDPRRRLARFAHSMRAGRDRIVLTRTEAAWRGCYGMVDRAGAVLGLAATADPPPGGVLHALDGVWSVRELGERVAGVLGWEGAFVEIDDADAPEPLRAPFASAVDLALTQARTDEVLGPVRGAALEGDTLDGAFRAAVAWDLDQPPPPTLGAVHEAEDAVG